MGKKFWNKVALGMAGSIFLATAAACSDKDDEKEKVYSENSSIESVEDVEISDKIEDILEELDYLKDWQQQILGKLNTIEGKLSDLDYESIDEIMSDLDLLAIAIENNKTISAEEREKVLDAIEEVKTIANQNGADLKEIKDAIVNLTGKVDSMQTQQPDQLSQQKLEELSGQLVDNVKIPLQYDKDVDKIDLFKEVDRIELKLPTCNLNEEDYGTISDDLLDVKKVLVYQIGEEAISKLSESNYIFSDASVSQQRGGEAEEWSAKYYYDLNNCESYACKDGVDYAYTNSSLYRGTIDGAYQEGTFDGIEITNENFTDSFLQSLKFALDDRTQSITYDMDNGFTIKQRADNYYTHVIAFEGETAFNIDENGVLNYFLSDETYYESNGWEIESAHKTEGTFEPISKEQYEEVKKEYDEKLDYFKELANNSDKTM